MLPRLPSKIALIAVSSVFARLELFAQVVGNSASLARLSQARSWMHFRVGQPFKPGMRLDFSEQRLLRANVRNRTIVLDLVENHLQLGYAVVDFRLDRRDGHIGFEIQL